MNIEFGCGETPTKKGFKTCDIRSVPGVDFVCPAWEIDQHIADNSVDEIFSKHFFEHLTFRQGRIVLTKWHKILKPTGYMEMMLPNMTYHVEQWLNKDKNPRNLKHSKGGFWGWQRGEFDDTWDIHKSGYDFSTLSTLLYEVGYKQVTSMTKTLNEKHLHVRCIK